MQPRDDYRIDTIRTAIRALQAAEDAVADTRPWAGARHEHRLHEIAAIREELAAMLRAALHS